MNIIDISLQFALLITAVFALYTWRKESQYNFKRDLFNELAETYYRYCYETEKFIYMLHSIQLSMAYHKTEELERYKSYLLSLKDTESSKYAEQCNLLYDIFIKLKHLIFKIDLFDAANTNAIQIHIDKISEIFNLMFEASKFIVCGSWFYEEPGGLENVEAFQNINVDLMSIEIEQIITQFQLDLKRIYTKL